MPNRSLMAVAMLVAATSSLFTAAARAAPPLTLYPEQIGPETARYYRGAVAVLLKSPTGTVEIRPLPVEKGRVALAVAVYNQSMQPANFGTENISATVNGLPVAVPTEAQLADAARQHARNARVGAVLLSGILAGAASTASNSGTYYRHVPGPYGGYNQSVHWQDDTPGVVGAVAAVGAGALVIHGIDRKLDYTLDQLSSRMLETTTVDPGNSFGGMIVVPTGKSQAYPVEIRTTVMFNGVPYPFAFRLTPSGLDIPPPFPATARSEAMPYRPEQPAAPVALPQAALPPAMPPYGPR